MSDEIPEGEDSLFWPIYRNYLRLFKELPENLPSCIKAYFSDYAEAVRVGPVAFVISEQSWHEIKPAFINKEMVPLWCEKAASSEDKTRTLVAGILQSPIIWQQVKKPTHAKNDAEMLKEAIHILKHLPQLAKEYLSEQLELIIKDLEYYLEDCEEAEEKQNDEDSHKHYQHKMLYPRPHRINDQHAIYRFYIQRIDGLHRLIFEKTDHHFVQTAIGAISNDEFEGDVANQIAPIIEANKKRVILKPAQ